MTGLPEVVPPASVKVLSAPTSKVPEFAIEPPVSLAKVPSSVKLAPEATVTRPEFVRVYDS